ncbi:MAG: ECF transporter S component [Asgard group archaeon]|nr:ECF transporter S component [Asgard group archaeon]
MAESNTKIITNDSGDKLDDSAEILIDESAVIDETQSIQELKEYTPKTTTLKIALLAIFTALGVAMSTMFIYFPNIELMSLTLFIGGIVLGPLYGSFLAILSATLYEIIATLIIGPGYVIFPFKIIAFLLIVLVGALIRKKIPEKPNAFWWFAFGVIGGLLTIFFDLITNIGWIILSDNFNFIGYISALVIGLPITASRVATNTVLFLFVPEIYNRSIRQMMPSK